MADRLDTPLASRNRLWHRLRRDPDAVGRYSEGVARFFGTPTFIIWLTVFVVVWLGWNTFGPEPLRFDSAALGFTALTLMLSLQASYSSPLILLAFLNAWFDYRSADDVGARGPRTHAIAQDFRFPGR